MLTRAKTTPEKKTKISKAIPYHFWYRFLALILVLTIGFSSVMVAGIGIGRAAPNPARDFFTSPDGSMCEMPCLFGIRPGHTTVREAIEMIHKHPLTRTLMFVPDWEYKLYLYKTTALFLGDAGQIVFIRIYSSYVPTNTHFFQVNFDPYDEVVSAVRVGSFDKLDLTRSVPPISDALQRAWHSATFTAVEEALQSNQKEITTPNIELGLNPGFYYAAPLLMSLESLYFNSALIVTHFPPQGTDLNRLIDKNSLSSLVVLDTGPYRGGRDIRLDTGFAARSFSISGTWQNFWQLHDNLLQGIYP